jgi:long-chain acyl-CoA synthetase
METADRPRADAPLHEHLRAHARRTPTRPAYVWYGREITFAEVDAASDAFAARLAALGVAKGEPVALYLNNCPQYVVAHYGIQKLGAIVCPCSPLNREHELQYQLEDLGARVIVAADDLLDVVGRVRPRTSLRHVFATRYGDMLPESPEFDLPPGLSRGAGAPLPDGVEDLLAVVRAGGRPPEVPIDPGEDVALMTYTSGTTGLPKGAMLTYRNASAKTDATVRTQGLGGDDVMLAVAPLYHIAGMLMGVNLPMATGATAVLLHRFDPVAVLQAIERRRVTWWYSIAPMNVAVMAVPGARECDLSSLRRNPVTSFGVAFTEALATQWRGFAPNCVSYEAAYGLSETHTMDTYMPVDAIRWGTHGLPVPDNEIRILDPDTGREKARNETGEIVLRNAGVFKGYWRNPEATARTLRDGWVHTGDMGRIDDDGYLTFIGRFKEMIKVSGYSVFPEEVESLLIRHPAIAQAAVIGVPDERRGEAVRAFVVRRPGQSLEADALVEWARANMAAYKVPRDVRFVDALPATGAGKVLRRMLRDAD